MSASEPTATKLPQFGDLVVDEENYHGVVIAVERTFSNDIHLAVFLANGLTVVRPAEEFRPRFLPNKLSPCNFAEILKSPAHNGVFNHA